MIIKVYIVIIITINTILYKMVEIIYTHPGVVDPNLEKNRKLIIRGFALAVTTALLFSRYNKARSNEFLVKTGFLINDMQIGKKFFKFPFQNIQKIYINPTSYHANMNIMYKNIEVKVPILFSIGPKADFDSLSKYARYLLNNNDEEVIIKSIIKDELKLLSANISIEDIYPNNNELKNTIIQHIQPKLDKYGIIIHYTAYNSYFDDIKEEEMK